MSHDVRVLEPDERRAAHELFAGSLHQSPYDDQTWERSRDSYCPGRTLGVAEGATAPLIGTASSFPTRTAVPGAVLDTAAVTRVGVRADRTRRGVLTAMMRAQLRDVVARGERLASLRASEARIYGRFGYGVATRGREVTVSTRGPGWRHEAPQGGTVRMLAREEVLSVLPDLHDSLALRRTGGITRPVHWWTGAVGRRLAANDHVVVAVHTGPDGDDGFAVAGAEGDSPFTDRTLRVTDLQAAGIEATAGLWRFLLDLDLVGRMQGWRRPLDEPLELLLADPRDCRVHDIEDETWLRLVDVPAALSARSWGDAPAVLLAVHDTLLGANAGVYRIGDGAAERVGPLGGPVEPELECDVAALAMAYLGDRLPSALAATGWWRVHDGRALPAADALFATGMVPWCGTYF